MKRRNFIKQTVTAGAALAALPLIGSAKDHGKGCNINGEHVCGPVMLRVIKLKKKGDSIPGHTHNFDHATMFVLGTVRVVGYDPKTNEKLFEKSVTAPDALNIPKNIRHELIAESDNCEAWCTFPHRDEEGKIVDAPASKKAYV